MPLPEINIKGAEKCPKCGSKERATDDYFKKLKEGKFLTDKFNEGCLTMSLPVMEAINSPLNLQRLIPVLMINIAVCKKCFTIYATRIVTGGGQMAPMQGMPKWAPTGGGQ